MKETIKTKIVEISGIITGIIIAALIVLGIGFVLKGCQEQIDNTTYEFEIIEKYEKLGSRFLSGSETEYRVIYRDRRLYKGKLDSDWKTYDISVRYDQYRNIQNGYHFKGKSEYFFTYDFN